MTDITQIDNVEKAERGEWERERAVRGGGGGGGGGEGERDGKGATGHTLR